MAGELSQTAKQENEMDLGSKVGGIIEAARCKVVDIFGNGTARLIEAKS